MVVWWVGGAGGLCASVVVSPRLVPGQTRSQYLACARGWPYDAAFFRWPSRSSASSWRKVVHGVRSESSEAIDCQGRRRLPVATSMDRFGGDVLLEAHLAQ